MSNLLFLETPAGVGYSYNLDAKYVYNDTNTAQDNIAALSDFFRNYEEYRNNKLFIAGESYAGKYIPDLAVQIDKQNLNASKQINLKGILVGNGIMDFRGGELERSSIEFMLDRDFVDPELAPYYKLSCLSDPDSAGCSYFSIEYDEDTAELNPYSTCSFTQTSTATASTTARWRRRAATPSRRAPCSRSGCARSSRTCTRATTCSRAPSSAPASTTATRPAPSSTACPTTSP